MSFIQNTKENFNTSINDKGIICFGYGETYNRFLSEFPEYRKKIVAVIDNDPSKWSESFVVGPEKIKDYLIDSIILITSAASEDIRYQLNNMHVLEENIYSFPFDNDFELLSKKEKMQKRIYEPSYQMLFEYAKVFKWKEKELDHIKEIIHDMEMEDVPVMPYCTFLVTSACTLKCRDCNNLIPYLDRSLNISFDDFRFDIDRLLAGVGHCVVMNFTGGEPFINRELKDIIEYAVKIDKISFIEVITNGTVIPDDELCKVISNKKVIVKISNYSGYSKTKDIISIFDSRSIKYQVYDDMMWLKSGDMRRRRKEKKRLQSEYLRCWAGMYCKSILNGMLFHCARAAFLYEAGVDLSDSDHVDLSDSNLVNNLIDFYIQPYADACDFCDHHNLAGGIIPAAIQIEG